MNLLDDIVGRRARSQAARATVLRTLQIEIRTLAAEDQVRVAEELSVDLAACLQEMRHPKQPKLQLAPPKKGG